MSVTLRLMRFGKKGYPVYRIVALDKRKKRDGSYLENVGQYDPMTQPAKVEIQKARFDHWISRGAQISEGVQKLLKNHKTVKFVEPTKTA